MMTRMYGGLKEAVVIPMILLREQGSTMFHGYQYRSRTPLPAFGIIEVEFMRLRRAKNQVIVNDPMEPPILDQIVLFRG